MDKMRQGKGTWSGSAFSGPGRGVLGAGGRQQGGVIEDINSSSREAEGEGESIIFMTQLSF